MDNEGADEHLGGLVLRGLVLTSLHKAAIRGVDFLSPNRYVFEDTFTGTAGCIFDGECFRDSMSLVQCQLLDGVFLEIKVVPLNTSLGLGQKGFLYGGNSSIHS